MVQDGGSLLRRALLVIAETFLDPFAYSVIWDEQPIGTRAAPEFDRAQRGGGTPFDPKRPQSVSPLFKLTFITVVVITSIGGLLSVVLAGIWTEPTEMQRQAFEGMSWAWKTGVGALLGLVCGKSLK
jgi:hypothetical protein